MFEQLQSSLGDYISQPLWQYYLSVAIVMLPAVRIFMRAGVNPAWSLALLFPWVGYVVCAVVLGFNHWPKASPLVLKKREKKA